MNLQDLEVGARFLFAATDLPRRGPCELLEKSVARATIRYLDVKQAEDVHTNSERFVEDRHGGRWVPSVSRRPARGSEPCSLTAGVTPLDVVGTLEMRGSTQHTQGETNDVETRPIP